MARGELFHTAVMTAETDKLRIARFLVLLHRFLQSCFLSFCLWST